MKRFALVLVGIISMLGMSVPFGARAFSIKPVKYRVVVDPGLEQIISVGITNTGTETRRYTIRMTGVKQDSEGRPIFKEGSSQAENWLYPETKEIIINAQETRPLFITVRPDKNAEPGTQYAAVLIQENTAVRGNIGILAETALLVQVDVAGEVREAVSIEKWEAIKSIQATPAWDSQFSIKNNGTISVPVSGEVIITNWRGREIARVPLQVGSDLLPATRREKLVSTALLKAWPGPYRLDAVVRFGASQAIARASSTVWYIPTWSISVVISLVLVVLIYRGLRRRTYRG
jgi:hypothetical protein